MEKELARIWFEILELDTVGMHDNFFDLGGNLLLAIRVAARVLKELKVEISLKSLLNATTIAQLAGEITENASGEVANEKLIALLNRIESLSDEEVQRWMVQHDSSTHERQPRLFCPEVGG